MAIFEVIGEVLGQILLEAIPAKISQWATGKDTGVIGGYRTEHKELIKFNVARKFLLTWENEMDHIRSKVTSGLEAMNEKSDVTAFQFRTVDERTIVQPAASISFYAFHFLVQWLDKNKIKTIGIVETDATTYTTYNDPHSENLIGETDRGKRFFISLMEDYSNTQFLRINADIKTIEGYDVLAVKSWLAKSR